MHCTECGTELPDESLFCSKCGTRLGGDDAAAEDQPARTPAERFRDASLSGDTDEDEERDLWTGGYSGKAMIGTWLLSAVGTVVMLVVGILFPPALLFLIAAIGLLWLITGAMLAYRKLSVKYELTTQRFIHKTGILKRVTDRIEVIDIDDVTFEQGIVQRMVNVGTIKINSSDRTHPELHLHGIEGVQEIANTIDDVRRKERRKRGLHIESI